MATDKQKEEFVVVLKHLGLFEPLSQYKVICPFHEDKNPSMLVNLDEAKFFCFGCQVHGNAYDLMHLSYPTYNSFELVQAMKRASLQGGKQAASGIVQVAAKKLNMLAVRDYYYNLPRVDWRKLNDPAKDYMAKRGFTSNVLNEAGARLNLTDAYKIVFPVLDNGAFRGYVGRTIDKEIEAKRKYIYNTGFRRSKTLCGTYDGPTVLVVEGFMDMLKARQFGVRSVVAILGWKISEQQVSKLKHRGVKTVVCGTDRDEAGKKGYTYLKGLGEFNVVRLHYPSDVKDFGDVDEEVYDRKIRQQIEKYFIGG